MIILILFFLGLCFGSFVNALVWRLRKQATTKKKAQKNKYSITKGRSMCVSCGHELAAKDLLPVISWVMLHGKCRYCSKPIPWQYPLVELATAILFVSLYIFWPDNLNSTASKVDLIAWIIASVGLMALFIYDLRYMILPNKIIFPLMGLAVVNLLLQSLITSDHKLLLSATFGVIAGGGLFYVLFQVSRGTWIGGGDVKLGFLLGLLLADPVMALLMLFVASVLGSIFSLILVGKKGVNIKTKIPFGPFLIAAAIIAKLLGQNLIDWYNSLFIY